MGPSPATRRTLTSDCLLCIAAVTADGDSNGMAAEELEPLCGGSSILARAEGELEPLFGGSCSRPKNWMVAAYGGAEAFRG